MPRAIESLTKGNTQLYLRSYVLDMYSVYSYMDQIHSVSSVFLYKANQTHDRHLAKLEPLCCIYITVSLFL